MVATASDIRQDCQALAVHRRLRPGVLPTLDSLLSPAELRRLACYEARYNALDICSRCAVEDLIVNLQDNPAAGWCTWTGVSGVLPTLRRSAGVYVYVPQHRQVTLKELYAAMGWPTFSALACASHVPMVDPFRANRSWSEARKQLGNGMHIACLGVLLSLWLATLKPKL